MSFFQNPFHEDFEGNWLLGDRQHIPKFVVKRNAGRGSEYVMSWKDGPYDLSGNDSDGDPSDTLKISFSLHGNKNWATISIDVTSEATSSAAVKSAEIVASLNADTLFSERFVAELSSYNTGTPLRVSIKQRKPSTEFKFYVINGQAEESLCFNARAGVAEIPTYFSRHSLANRFTFEDSVGMLIELDIANNVDEGVINTAVDHRGTSLGFSSSSVSQDWQLLEGRSGLFQFTKGPSITLASSTTSTIIYHAGAKAGDLAKKIVVQKDAGGLVVAEFEIPYTLESGDLITPPDTYNVILTGGAVIAGSAINTVT